MNEKWISERDGVHLEDDAAQLYWESNFVDIENQIVKSCPKL